MNILKRLNLAFKVIFYKRVIVICDDLRHAEASSVNYTSRQTRTMLTDRFWTTYSDKLVSSSII